MQNFRKKHGLVYELVSQDWTTGETLDLQCRKRSVDIYSKQLSAITKLHHRSLVVRVIDKIREPRSESPICQSLVCLQTELDDKKSCCQLIITVTISENNKYIQVIYFRQGQCLKQKIFSILEISQYFQDKWLLL